MSWRRSILSIVVSGMSGFACGDAGWLDSDSQALSAGPPRVIVVGQSETSPETLESLVAAEHGAVHRRLGLINAVSATLPDQAAAARLRTRPEVQRVEDDVLAFVLGHEDPVDAEGKPGGSKPPPQQPAQTVPWGIGRIGADQVWGMTTGAGVKIAIIDTGLDSNHPDLMANIAGGANFTLARSWEDDNGHGTHVGGTVAALSNAIGVVGAAPQARLYAVKVLNKRGVGYISDIIAGLDWCAANGIRIASMSLGAAADSQSLHDACDRVEAAGVLLIAAAGNSGDGDPATDNVEYPGRYESVIAVAAIDSGNAIAWFSSDGPEVDLAAPGVSVSSTWSDGFYRSASGTSMATPHVTGAAALLIAAKPAISNACVRQLLTSTATDLGIAGPDVFSGSGLPNVAAALNGLNACD